MNVWQEELGVGRWGESRCNNEQEYWSCLSPRAGDSYLYRVFALPIEAVQRKQSRKWHFYEVIIFNSLLLLRMHINLITGLKTLWGEN